MPYLFGRFWLEKCIDTFKKRFSSILEQFGGIFSPALEIRIEQLVHLFSRDSFLGVSIQTDLLYVLFLQEEILQIVCICLPIPFSF